jgi:hypothetical protein
MNINLNDSDSANVSYVAQKQLKYLIPKHLIPQLRTNALYDDNITLADLMRLK